MAIRRDRCPRAHVVKERGHRIISLVRLVLPISPSTVLPVFDEVQRTKVVLEKRSLRHRHIYFL